jgi:Domain of unknown function (DUF4384)/BON domain
VWKLVAVVVGLVVLWAVYSFWYLSGPPCPSVAEIAAKIQQHPATKQCANVSVTAERCVVRLQGRVENATQRSRLREVAQNIKGIAFVNDALLRVVPAPFCEILDLLEPFQKHAETQNFDLKVRLVNKEAQKLPVYVQGEHLIIEGTTPAKFDSFVYVDYYATDGQVQHLFPNLQEALNFFPPRSVYSVGQPDGQHFEWKPLPPFGRELLSVIVSKQPLVFTPKAPRYDPEPVNVYLDQLRAALPRDLAQAEIGAAIYSIETRGPEQP